MRGAVAAGHELTAEAGAETLRLGGNAFDAALAACFASFVAESALTSPGGGGFLMARTSSDGGGKTVLYDFFSNVPGLEGKKGREGLDFFPVKIDFAGRKQEVNIGRGSTAVPGIVSGLSLVHRNHCTLPLETILGPAIRYARQGVRLTGYQAYFNNLLSPMLCSSEGPCRIYSPGGTPLAEGDTIFHRDMADAFEYLAREGLDRFYDGDVAEGILRGFGEAGGGLITRKDLESYGTAARRPLRFTYRGREILTNPPPSSGGALTAFSLKLLEAVDVGSFRHGSAHYLKTLSEAMRVTDEARKDLFDRRVYEDGLEEEFLSGATVDAYRKKASFSSAERPGGGIGNTTQISVIDGDGNVASVTTSVGMGCGVMIPGTGIMMNNMLGEKDLNPLGFHAQPPGVRISSMMAPTIVTKDSAPEAVLGSGGSKRIRGAILQVLLNLIDGRLPAGEAVNSPRAHWEGGVLDVEPGIREEELSALEKEGFTIKRWSEKNMYFGGVHTVTSGPDGFSGAGDERRGGVFKAVY